MHASDATTLFFGEEEEVDDDDIYGGVGGEVGDEWDSRGGSPVDEGDPDMAIPVR